MQVRVAKFNKQDRPEFYKELRKRVNGYFKDNNISKYANFNMKFKTFFMICLYFTPLIVMLTGGVTGVWPVMGMWALMGLGMSGIGLSIMHDANHGSYSKNKNVNNFLGYMIHFVGGYRENWKIQHNVLHHSFTNVHGLDEDIKTPIIRMSPNQKPSKWYRFQAYYAPFVYGIMTLYWSTAKDFDQILRYKRKDLLKGQGLTFRKAMLQCTFTKTWYYLLTLVLPLMVVDLPWWQILLGYVLMHFICGLALAFIFQPAHVLEETEFFTPSEKGTLDNNWAIHQLKTTSNFANGAKLFSWFVGGLNYQVEHHLFPNICHVHYKDISKIVRKTTEEYGLPYHSHKTFYAALRSHFSLLNQLGKNRIPVSV